MRNTFIKRSVLCVIVLAIMAVTIASMANPAAAISKKELQKRLQETGLSLVGDWVRDTSSGARETLRISYHNLDWKWTTNKEGKTKTLMSGNVTGYEKAKKRMQFTSSKGTKLTVFRRGDKLVAYNHKEKKDYIFEYSD